MVLGNSTRTDAKALLGGISYDENEEPDCGRAKTECPRRYQKRIGTLVPVDH
jgi:hypothetical protein